MSDPRFDRAGVTGPQGARDPHERFLAKESGSDWQRLALNAEREYKALLAERDASMDEARQAIKERDKAEAERDALREELDATKQYAAEGWAWLDDALEALGAKTVFDIPKLERPE
jgi:hypothetical protein